MMYNEAINGPDGEQWKAEVENKYQQMLHNNVFETVMIANLPPGINLINGVWAMKKKSNGVLCSRVNARGFKQVEGQCYNSTTISSLVTNTATIRIVLTFDVSQFSVQYNTYFGRARLRSDARRVQGQTT